ncbi:endolytic transglycosylase MltG [Patescibacteria group bacterium]|nr:endolytic transglycosylase MltG [Patescibacteria group bacterium]
MEKRLIQFILFCILAVVFFTLLRPFWKLDLNEAANPKDESKIVFEIEKGESGSQIAKNLKKQDLIVSKESFIRTIKKEDLDQNLRFGRFVLSPNMTLREIITILTTAGTGELAFTEPEGWTIDDIDARLTELGLIESGDFKKCTLSCEFDYDFLPENSISLEGYLFPDTYFIDSETFSSESLINQMLQNFDRKLTEQMRKDIESSGRTIQEVVIVASMLEKEVRTEDDIPFVAGIIWKRLDNDWTLGIDATLLYTKEDNTLTAEDLASDSSYNTRINKGLPPTAISNPGLASLEGAIYPEDSRYWFYLTDIDTGEVIYAETNEEHEKNKSKHL